MVAVRRFKAWLGRLVHRPADLFDIASGCGTLLIILLMVGNWRDPATVPSLSFLEDVAPKWLWLLIVGVAAALQPVALHFDDPGDERHPLLQILKWVRSVLALIVGAWFLILIWSLVNKLGPHHVAGAYALPLGMNAYILAHVMFRARA